MSDEIRAEIKTAAKALCHYQSGPSDVNSCCPGIGRCEIDAAIAEITRLRAALTTMQVEALKKSAEIARQFAQSEGWSGTSALRLRNCIIAEAAIYTKTGGKDE